jgi:hypothetical protein
VGKGLEERMVGADKVEGKVEEGGGDRKRGKCEEGVEVTR